MGTVSSKSIPETGLMTCDGNVPPSPVKADVKFLFVSRLNTQPALALAAAQKQPRLHWGNRKWVGSAGEVGEASEAVALWAAPGRGYLNESSERSRLSSLKTESFTEPPK